MTTNNADWEACGDCGEADCVCEQPCYECDMPVEDCICESEDLPAHDDEDGE